METGQSRSCSTSKRKPKIEHIIRKKHITEPQLQNVICNRFRVCFDGRKRRERKKRDLEGRKIPCLDSEMGRKEFGGEGIGRI